MNTTRCMLVLAFVCAGLLSSPAFASWPNLDKPPTVAPTTTKDVAVIVAIEDYLLLPDVPGAVQNANDWEVFLRQGLKVKDVHVLANQDATREGILKFAKIAANDVGKGGTIWWVFIGHGAPTVDGKDGILVGMDAQQTAESLQARGVRQNELLASLESESNNTVVLLDACYSGRSGEGEALAAGVQPVIAISSTPQLGSTSVLMSAAKSTEVAGQLPGAQRPAFSYLMLGALRGWADDGDGKVTASEAIYYVRRELRGVKGRQQTPQMVGNLDNVLSRGVSEADPDVSISATDTPVVTTPVIDPQDAQKSEAERKLLYLSRRVTFDGVDFRQDGRVLDPIPFYHAVERPDLAEEFRGHTPWMWITGAAMTVGGVALMAWGFSAEDEVDEDGVRTSNTGQKLGGIMGGFFMMSGGIALFTIGVIKDEHPMSEHERESLAQVHNKKLRESLGLGPEADTPVERRDGGSFWNPFSALPPKQYGVGVRVLW